MQHKSSWWFNQIPSCGPLRFKGKKICELKALLFTELFLSWQEIEIPLEKNQPKALQSLWTKNVFQRINSSPECTKVKASMNMTSILSHYVVNFPAKIRHALNHPTGTTLIAFYVELGWLKAKARIRKQHPGLCVMQVKRSKWRCFLECLQSSRRRGFVLCSLQRESYHRGYRDRTAIYCVSLLSSSSPSRI